MGNTGKQHRAAGIAMALLCLYLFEAFAVNVLHPLYHTHEHGCTHHTEVLNHAHHQTYATPLLAENSSNAKAAVSQPCILCHFNAQLKLIASTFSYEQAIAASTHLYKEFGCTSFLSGFNVHQPSRAPPCTLS